MREQMRRDLVDAIVRRDRLAASVLRSVLAAIDNAEAVPADTAPDAPDARDGADAAADAAPEAPAQSEHVAGAAVGVGATEVPRRELSDRDVDRIVAQEIDERVQAARQYAAGGQHEAAAQLAEEIALLRDYRLTS